MEHSVVKNGSTVEEDLKVGLKVAVIGGIVNLLLSAVKLGFGILGNSAAMVADAVHSMSDLLTDVVAYFSLKISSAEADEQHPYGHGRAESIGGGIIGMAVIFVGIGIAWEVLNDVLAGEFHIPDSIALWGAVISILVNEWLFRYTKKEGERIRSDVLVANAWHHRSDAISSIAVLIGVGGAAAGYPLMDPLAAVVVSVMIAKAGWDISTEAVNNLMDSGVSFEELEEMKGIIKNGAGVLAHHELKTRKVGRDTFVDVHIQVAPRISVSEAHNIAETIRRHMRESISHVTDALIHIDSEEDLHGRSYKVGRQDILEMAKTRMEAVNGAEIDGEVIMHLFLHQVCLEIPIKIADGTTAAEAKKLAENVVNAVKDGEVITEVDVFHRLTDKSL